MSGVEGAEREDLDEREAGVKIRVQASGLSEADFRRISVKRIHEYIQKVDVGS